jgi:multicomponent Na+:H+ antiporter subunit E
VGTVQANQKLFEYCIRGIRLAFFVNDGCGGSPMSARTFILKTITLFGLWVLLSGKIDAFHLSVGLLGAAVIAWVNTKPRHPDEPPLPLMRLAAYAPWLFWQIMKSGLHITKVILDPQLPVNPKLIRYRTKLGNNHAVVLLANSITLTPGTVTTDVVSGELVVHALDDQSSGDLLSGTMEQKIDDVFHSNRSA